MNAYKELIDFIVTNIKPEVLVGFKSSDEAHTYFYDLLAKEKAGIASLEEKKELDRFMEVEHILRMAKQRARTYAK